MAFGRSCEFQIVVFSLIVVCIAEITIPEINTICAQDGILPVCPMEKDFGKYGKFNCCEPYFDLSYRPVCCLPQDSAENCTQFCLVNGKNSASFCTPISENNVPSSFDGSKCTIFVIHGYSVKDNATMSFIFDLLQALVEYKTCNVIFVNWTACNGNNLIITYPQAFGNSRLVSAHVASFIGFLRTIYELSLETLHIIGHSLGAHIAGGAGRIIPGIGRISLLDPAGTYCQDQNESVCACKSNADFVMSIHTNGAPDGAFHLDGYGKYGRNGYCDFYVNGGIRQPGCENTSSEGVLGVTTAVNVTHYNSCSHRRAVDLFTESIIRTICKFTGYTCQNGKTPDGGDCTGNSSFAEMGYNSSKSECVGKSYFVKTYGTSPFCISP